MRPTLNADRIKWLGLGRMKYYYFFIPDPKLPRTKRVQVTVIHSRGRKHSTLVAMIHYGTEVWSDELECGSVVVARALNKLLGKKTKLTWTTRDMVTFAGPMRNGITDAAILQDRDGRGVWERTEEVREKMRVSQRARREREKKKKSKFTVRPDRKNGRKFVLPPTKSMADID